MNPVRAVIRTVLRRIWSLGGDDGDELRYAAAVSIWVRWIFIVGCVVEANCRAIRTNGCSTYGYNLFRRLLR